MARYWNSNFFGRYFPKRYFPEPPTLVVGGGSPSAMPMSIAPRVKLVKNDDKELLMLVRAFLDVEG